MEYVEYLKSHNFAETTIKEYTRNIKLFKEYLQATKNSSSDIILYNIKEYDIYNYISYMIAKGNSQQTRSFRLNGLRNYYTYICKNTNIENPFNNIQIKINEKRLPKVICKKDIKRLYNYYSGRNQLIIHLLLATGIRVNELASLCKKNIQNNMITFIAKGNKERTMYIPKNLSLKLNTYIKNLDSERLFPKKRAIQEIVTNAMKDLQIEGSTHTLRHTAATIMYENTHDILLVREFLGHSTVASTEIYAHINNIELKKAVDSNPLNNI